MSDNNKANRLINEKSPYLLQHAYNPVDWYPWSDEAFEKAGKENKPVFLSIGYSTCHWCHVMEHESFEDSAVAALMNDTFISIKVDREERPDIDNVYMTVCQMLTGRGGWPLTIIMTPDKKPFYAATYIPKKGAYGRIGMMELIPRIAEAWKSKNHELINSAESVVNYLEQYNEDNSGDMPGKDDLDNAYNNFSHRFDGTYGGFGNAPKFPSPHNLLFLLRYWKRTADDAALAMVEKTLTEMSKGGIFDHVGFGFHRYSTDRFWKLPHFEKMLYDQAMLAIAYLETYLASGNPYYAKISEKIFEYVLRDMTSTKGGFYSAEDADSEGEEGKFYVWTKSELVEILGSEDAEMYSLVYNFEDEGNYEDEASREKSGTNIPHLRESLSFHAEKTGIGEKELKEKIENCRIKLFNEREKRIHPLKDDKILTDWNGLMIAAFAMGGRILKSEKYIKAAESSADFIFGHLINEDGRLLHRFREGQAGLQASVEDHAFLIWGLIELYEATFNPVYLTRAIEIQKVQNEFYWDEEAHGYFFSPSDGEELITRTKEIYDGAIPSGNSVSAMNLLKLGRILADKEYENKYARIGAAFSKKIKKEVIGSSMFLAALDYSLGPAFEIIFVSGSGYHNDSIVQKINGAYLPNKVVLFVNQSADNNILYDLADYTKNYQSVDGKTTAYICENYTCNLPVTDPDEVLKLVNKK